MNVPTITKVTRADKKRAEREVQRSLNEWQLVFHGGAEVAKVHGSGPIGGRYPAEGLEVSIGICLPFPDGISDAIPGDPTEQVKHYVEHCDATLSEWLGRASWTNLRPYWDDDGDGFALAHNFPPVFGNESEEITSRFRLITDEEKREVELATGSPYPPFSDEQWVETRYAGINLFRTIEWRPLGGVA